MTVYHFQKLEGSLYLFNAVGESDAVKRSCESRGFLKKIFLKIRIISQISSILLKKSAKLITFSGKLILEFMVAKKLGIFQICIFIKIKLETSPVHCIKQNKKTWNRISYFQQISPRKFGNHPDSRKLWKAKSSALNSQSETLYTQKLL